MTNVVETNPLAPYVRSDLPGRFNELDVLRRHWARFAAVSQGAIVPPYEVLIHPSSGCNLRCAWCIGDHVPLELWDEQREQLVMLDAAKDASDRLPDHLTSPENMLKLIGDIVDYEVEAPYRQGGEDRSGVFTVEAVSFSGLIGEPLVARKALIPAFALLAERGIRYGIFTNAVLMDDACIEALLPAGYVHISIDAGTPGTYADLKYGGRKGRQGHVRARDGQPDAARAAPSRNRIGRGDQHFLRHVSRELPRGVHRCPPDPSSRRGQLALEAGQLRRTSADPGPGAPCVRADRADPQ
ncbi:radical SAM protein [Streptomyces rubradiris]|uniref:radical SAM protein n=1 Tax=Streptomyces rubradiris TaxID=285531 RepID=UPI0036E55AEF